MNRVKAGLTILLNTATNTTFIASTMDAEVQTGTRDNDSHIEWAGELSQPVIVPRDLNVPLIQVEDELRNYARWKNSIYLPPLADENKFVNQYINSNPQVGLKGTVSLNPVKE